MKKLLLGALFAFGLATAYADTFIAKPALHEGVTGVTVTGVTTQLTVLSETVQHLMGSTSQIVALPEATTLKPGRYWVIRNDSSQSATVRYFGGTTLSTVRPATSLVVRLKSAVTSDGDWTLETQDFIRTAGDTMSGSLGLDYATADRAAYVDGAKVLRTSTTVSSQELEYLDGVTSNLGARVNNFTDAEGARLAGVTSGIQSQIDSAFSVISGKVNRSADTMTGSFGLSYANVTPDRAAYVDGSRIVRTSTSVSSQELEYLDGVTANIQAQIAAAGGGGGSFVSKTGDTMTGPLRMQGGANGIIWHNNAGNFNWLATSNNFNSNEYELTPSTLAGGTTYTTPVFRLSTAGNLRLSGTIQAVGGTMTGALLLDTAPLTVLNATPTFIRNGAVDTEVRLEGVSTQAKLVTFRNNTVDRWKIGMLSNGNFGLLDYDSAGSFLGTLISVPSGSGVISITRALTVSDTALSTFGGSLKANQDILIGQSGAGSGGKVRIFCDSGTECWRIGPAGSAGAVDLDFRSQLAGLVAMSISTAGMTTTFRGNADASMSVQTPAVSSSYTIGNNVSTFVIAPSTNLTTSTAIMPASPANFQRVSVSCSGSGITNFTHLASGAHTLEHPMTSCSRGSGGTWEFQNSGSGFWRLITKSEATASELYLQGATTYASTDNKIRVYITTVKNEGNAWTLTQNATNGTLVTLLQEGQYAMHMCDNFSAAANMGISLNASSTTNGIQTLAPAQVACGNVSASVDIGVCCSDTRYLPAGTVIRPHTDGTANGSNLWMQSFRIRKISN